MTLFGIKFLDADGDGKITFADLFFILRMAVYTFGGLWCILHPKDYSDIQYVATVSASFGAGMFEIFLRAKIEK